MGTRCNHGATTAWRRRAAVWSSPWVTMRSTMDVQPIPAIAMAAESSVHAADHTVVSIWWVMTSISLINTSSKKAPGAAAKPFTPVLEQKKPPGGGYWP